MRKLPRKKLHSRAFKIGPSGHTLSDPQSKCHRESTVVQNRQESGREYWVIRSSVRSFARTTHSFAGSTLLASLARSAALCSLSGEAN